MLRIEFSVESLLHTRFHGGPAPLLELGLAVATMQRRDAMFDRWRRDTRACLDRTSAALFELVPASGAGPTFLDPISDGIDDGLDLVLSAPDSLVSEELRRVTASGKAVTPWLRGLDTRDREAWDTLSTAVRLGYDAMIGPSWPQITAAYRADVAVRSRVIADQGIQAMLLGLHPGSSWDGAVLQIPVNSRLHVTAGAAAGVVLIPSVLWSGRPLVAPLADGSLLIVYAAATPLPLVQDISSGHRLAHLLGPTRAAILTGAQGTHTTGELARLLGVSAASVSDHTKILRGAGLITSTRQGKTVLHCATDLGAQLAWCTAPPKLGAAPG